MKHSLRLLAFVAVSLGLTVPAIGQTVDLRLNTTINVGAGTGGLDQLEVTVEADTDIDVMLGNSNFRFFFNSAALDVPSGMGVGSNMVVGTDYVLVAPFNTVPWYSQSSTAGLFQQADLVSGNPILLAATFGGTLTAAGGFEPIMKFFFDITDDTQTEGLVWKTAAPPNPTQIFDGADNLTPVTIGLLTGSNKSLDPLMPVELSTFSTVVSDDAVTVWWSTASESNNAGFAVEIAPVGTSDWSEAGFVTGAGTSTTLRNYAFDVKDLAYGTYRVRLKTVNLDGAFDYSPELEVSIQLDEAFRLGNVYPSPFANSASFSLAVRDPQPVQIDVFNLLGQKVQTVFEGDLGGNQTRSFSINGASLSNGIYIVRAKGTSFATTTTVAVVK